MWNIWDYQYQCVKYENEYEKSKTEYEYEIYMCSHLVLNTTWETEIK